MKRSFDQAGLAEQQAYGQQGQTPSNVPANFRSGDWMCSKCQAHNYASKTTCFRCGALPGANLGLDISSQANSFSSTGLDLAAQAQAAAQGMNNLYAGMAGMQGVYGMQGIGAAGMMGAMANMQAGIGYNQYTGQYQQNQYQASGYQAGGYQTTNVSQPAQRPVTTTTTSSHPNMRPGDWICTSCKAHNYKDKIVCFKCKGPNLTGGFGGQHTSAVNDFRAGDWMCPGCNAHNYASKSHCYKCNIPKPATQQALATNPQVQGLLANVAKLGPEGKEIQKQIQQLLSASASKKPLPHNFRPGDWMCPSCDAHNYSGKPNCFKCRAEKPPNAEKDSLAQSGGFPPNFRAGDWMCEECNAHNYASKSQCYKCSASKKLGGGSASTPGNVEKKQKVEIKLVVVEPESTVISVEGIVDEKGLKEDEAYEKLCAEKKEEFSAFGSVVSMHIPRSDEGKTSETGHGKVYVRFETIEHARQAIAGVKQKENGGKPVVVKYFPLDKFEAKDFSTKTTL